MTKKEMEKKITDLEQEIRLLRSQLLELSLHRGRFVIAPPLPAPAPLPTFPQPNTDTPYPTITCGGIASRDDLHIVWVMN